MKCRSVTLVVEAKTIDQRLLAFDAEHTGLWVTGLGPRRDGADFDKAEAKAEQRADRRRVLVKARGQADRIGEVTAPEAYPQDRIVRRIAARAQATGQGAQRQPVRQLGIKIKAT